jgi:hypothetical protein
MIVFDMLTMSWRCRFASDYQDEADKFYANPSLFITEKILPTPSRPSPTYVVVFDSLLEMPSQVGDGTVGRQLQEGNYTEVGKDNKCLWH